MQYLVSSRSVCCHPWHRLRADCSPLLVCATYGSIQSVRKADTAYIQCPPEDERCDARNMYRNMIGYYCWIKKIVHQVGCKISILYHDARSKISQKNIKCNNWFPVPNFYTGNKTTAQQYVSWHTNSSTFVDRNKLLETNWLYHKFPSSRKFYSGVQWNAHTGRSKTPPCVVISAAKFVCYNHKCNFYSNIYLWAKIELQYGKCTPGAVSFESGPNVLYSTWIFRFFAHFLQKIVRIGIWNKQGLLLCKGFPIYSYSLCQKHSALSIGDKTGNVRISVTVNSVRVTIVAVEKQ
jgi:hypothetical protein